MGKRMIRNGFRCPKHSEMTATDDTGSEKNDEDSNTIDE
jgi:hypothetical protein